MPSARDIIDNGINPAKLTTGRFYLTQVARTAGDFAAATTYGTEELQAIVAAFIREGTYNSLVASGQILETELNAGATEMQIVLNPGAFSMFDALPKTLMVGNPATGRFEEC